jgi:tetratricopeptide (TPR) repeat protein
MKIFFVICLLPLTSFCQTSAPKVLFPASVSGASFVYHPKSEALLLIGGTPAIPDSVRSDIWKWDGKNWSKIDAVGPGARNFFPGVVNTKTGNIYSYAGMKAIGDVPMKDMWSFNGRSWSKVTTDDIGTHDHHNMVYMDHLDAFLVFGGNNNGYPNFDTVTWLLKGGKFKALNIPGPGYRWHDGMVYDKQRKKVVLYGGGEKPDEHWEFDGERWTKIVTTLNPGRRLYHYMAYNDDLKVVILHGGLINQDPRDPVHDSTPTTWEWNGISWKKIAEDPVFAMAMGYDTKRKKVVIYGKTDRSEDSNIGLWELNNNKWVKIVDYGKWNMVEYVKQWTEQHPDDIQALVKYADILEWRTKEFAKAETAYKKLVTVYPQDIGMFSSLAYVLSAQGKIDEANGYLQRLNELGSLNKNIYARLAGRLRQEKKFNEAIVYYNKILETDPKGKDFYSLACTYALVGEKEKAFDNLNKAIENGYNSKKQFEDDANLISLRSDKRFQDLLSKLK